MISLWGSKAEFLGPIMQKLWILMGLQNHVHTTLQPTEREKSRTPLPPKVHLRFISQAHSKFSINPAGGDSQESQKAWDALA